jgi:hypothetical protein
MKLDLKAIDLGDAATALKWLVGVGLLIGILAIGWNLGANSKAEDLAKMERDVAVQKMALQIIAVRLREVNAAAAAAVKAEKKAKAAAADAGKVAARAERHAEDLQNDFDKRLRTARKNPSCEALLNSDVRKVCGL